MINGTKIRDLRDEIKISQEDFAVDVGVTQVHLSHLERGMKQPSVEVFKRIADRLHVTMDELMMDND